MSRGRTTLLVAAALAAGAAGGCGGDDAGRSTVAAPPAVAETGLIWKGAPSVFAPDDLPRDRIVTGTIRNASGAPVDLRVDRVDVRGSDGKSLGANVRFVSSFGHGLYGPGGPPAPLEASRYDQERLGERLTLAANDDRPVTVAWRVPEGRAPAATVEISGFSLDLP